MLKALINDTYTLDLPKDISIRMNSENPVFNFTTGAFSYPFKTNGGSSKNRLALNFPHRSSRYPSIQTENEIKIFDDDLQIISGTIATKEASKDVFNHYIKADNGNFYSLIKGQKMAEVDLGGARNLGANRAAALATYDAVAATTYPASDYAIFPVCNTNFYDGFTSLETTWKNNNSVVNWYHSGNFKNIRATSPFPYLCYFLRQLFETNGYIIKHNFFEQDNELKTLCIYNANAASTWYLDAAWNVDVNTTMNLADHVPDFLITDFLKALQLRFNCSFHIDDITKEVRIVKNETFLNVFPSADLTRLFSRPIKWTNKLPTGFLLNSNNDDQDEQIIYNSMEGATVLDSVSTYGSLPAVGNNIKDIRLVEDINTYYVWDHANDGTLSAPQWIVFANFWPYGVGDESTEYTSEIDTLKMYSGAKIHATDPYTEWLVPRADQLGNIADSWQWTGNEFSPRLLFYRGMYDDEASNSYPLGSSDVYDYARNVIANYSLRWHGSYGLYEKFWKNWLYHRMNYGKTGSISTFLRSHEIRNIKNWEKYNIDNFSLLPVKKDYTLFNNGKAQLNLDFYKL